MEKIDYSNLESKFGLPSVVEHCSHCLMTNQKPFSINETTNSKGSKKLGMPINKDFICAACEYSFRKKEIIDWDDREQKLLKMLEKVSHFNCILFNLCCL